MRGSKSTAPRRELGVLSDEFNETRLRRAAREEKLRRVIEALEGLDHLGGVTRVAKAIHASACAARAATCGPKSTVPGR